MAAVKLASHTHTMTQWQRHWNIAEVGREYFKYVPSITAQRRFDLPTKQAYSRILPLQRGYNGLNQYRSKLGQTESILCKCGHAEDTEYFLLQILGHEIGLYHINMQT